MILKRKNLYIHINNFYFFEDLFLDYLKYLSKEYSIFIITSRDIDKKKQLEILKRLKKNKIVKYFTIYKSKFINISNLRLKKNINFEDILLTEVPKNFLDMFRLLCLYKNLKISRLIISRFDNFVISKEIIFFNKNSFLSLLINYTIGKDKFGFFFSKLLNMMIGKKLYFVTFNNLTRDIYKKIIFKSFSLKSINKNKNSLYKNNLIVIISTLKKKREKYLAFINEILFKNIIFLKNKFKIKKIYIKPHPREFYDVECIKLSRIIMKKFQKGLKNCEIILAKDPLCNYLKTAKVVTGFSSTAITLARRYSDEIKIIPSFDVSKIIQNEPRLYCGEIEKYHNGISWIDKKNSIKTKKLINKINFDFHNFKNFLKYVLSN